MRVLIPALSATLLLGISPATAPSSAYSAPEPGAERVVTNDNRTTAGVFADGVLTVRLEAREGEWRPDGDDDAGVVIHAFAEEGGPLLNPGPLMRVTEGTLIRVTLRNSLPSSLILHGFYTRTEMANQTPDTFHIAAGATREIAFQPGRAGTYFYWATTRDAQLIAARVASESQLSGALVVDPAGVPARQDRIMMIGLWPDSVAPVAGLPRLFRIVINGKSWPHTERLDYQTGDTVRWRVINAGAAVHPMHLHGFYFQVNSRGTESVDSAHAAESPPDLAVTERLTPGRTTSITWIPERAGNWIFHCHDNVHIVAPPSLPGQRKATATTTHAHNHALEMMGGPVIGVHVRARTNVADSGEPGGRRQLRLVARADKGGTNDEPAYGYALEEGGVSEHQTLQPGPTIVLKRGEPVSITVVNEIPEPTAVHWHGIELESYYDGVAGFAGQAQRIAPPIAPRDSFEVRFTPPRAGTFIYHTHIDEVRQQQAGLYGALLVIEPDRIYDAESNIVLVIGTPRRAADAAAVVLLNGTSAPALRELRVGKCYRLRLINIHTFRPSMIASLLDASGAPVSWRAIAKDGADLPAERATVRPAVRQLGNGETYDFEFTPAAAGDMRLEVRAATGLLLVTMPLRTR
jgi:FtsP/CotA-like multicopper oxidase with cupredoxin domain